MNDVVKFVRARLDEAERAATLCVCSFHEDGTRTTDRCPHHSTIPPRRPLLTGGYRLPLLPDGGWLLVDPARVLAEVQAKRAILDAAENWHMDHEVRDCILQNLALPYAEHADYRPEWRPAAEPPSD